MFLMAIASRMSSNLHRLQALLPEQVYREVSARARAERRSMSSMATALIEEGLRRTRRQLHEPENGITQEQAEVWQQRLMLLFAEACRVQAVFPAEGWPEIEAQLKYLHNANKADCDWAYEMVFGLRRITADEASRIAVRYPGCDPCFEALEAWSGVDCSEANLHMLEAQKDTEIVNHPLVAVFE